MEINSSSYTEKYIERKRREFMQGKETKEMKVQ